MHVVDRSQTKALSEIGAFRTSHLKCYCERVDVDSVAYSFAVQPAMSDAVCSSNRSIT